MIDIKTLELEQVKDNLPQFAVGDTVRVLVKVIEGFPRKNAGIRRPL